MSFQKIYICLIYHKFIWCFQWFRTMQNSCFKKMLPFFQTCLFFWIFSLRFIYSFHRKFQMFCTFSMHCKCPISASSIYCLRFLSWHLFWCFQFLFQLFVKSCLKNLFGYQNCTFPVFFLQHIFRNLNRTILFHPLPGCVRRHRNTSILCLSKSCLNLQITSCLICEILLPVIRRILISPGKKLSAT